ncbi:MAG TPA: YncE family protein [Streptosporangiaceae bacterium]|nr:YncE family protein [Streptosporangiaceae bacterium]
MTTLSLGRTMSAFALATAACMIAMTPPAWSSVTARAGGPHVVATIGLDREPVAVATDPATGMVYVTEPFKLVVIDGKTNTVVASVHVPDSVFGVATDSATGMVYVSDPAHLSVLVINGKTNKVTATIKVGGGIFWFAVNPLTDRIYAQANTNTGLESVVVIDGRTNKVVARIDDQNLSEGVAVNPVTNTVYSAAPGSILIISGQTNKVTGTISAVGGLDIATNPRTDTIYVSTLAGQSAFVSVIDGKTRTLTTMIPVSDIFDLAVDRLTNFVYDANYDRSTVAVIDGRTNSVVANVPVGRHPRDVAVNQQTNTIYVTDTGSRSVSVIAGAG